MGGERAATLRILGLGERASDEEIRLAYRALAEEW
jgi:DnaJ-class molecular chaperone